MIPTDYKIDFSQCSSNTITIPSDGKQYWVNNVLLPSGTYQIRQTSESQWPTAEEIEKAAKEKYPADKHHYQMFAVDPILVWKACAQWLQTSAGTREGELEKCLGELIKWYDHSFEESNLTMKGIVTKAKSLLSKTI